MRRGRSISSYVIEAHGSAWTPPKVVPPRCNRCGRLWETCVQYDPAGCIGVPLPADLRPVLTPEQRDYMQTIDAYRLKVRVR